MYQTVTKAPSPPFQFTLFHPTSHLKTDRKRTSAEVPTKHPSGCHSHSPRSRLVEPKTGGKVARKSIDPCGRTPNRCATTRVVWLCTPPSPRRSFGAFAPPTRGYLSGTLPGALMPILADVQSNLIPIVETFYRVIPNRGWKKPFAVSNNFSIFAERLLTVELSKYIKQ